MRYKLLIVLLFTLTFSMAIPVWAHAATVQGGICVGTISGIAPVSPSGFTAKFQQLGDRIYGAASPLEDMIAKLALAGAGLILILAMVFGAGTIRWVLGVAVAVVISLLLFYSAPWIVGIVKYSALWFQH